jgi:hypothetical protein
MTTKELLYVEDALNHVQYLMTQYRSAAGELRDQHLRSEALRMADEQQKLFTSFYNLV